MVLKGSPNGESVASHALEYHVNHKEICMQIETTKKLFTVDEYYRMADAGILKPDDRVELIDGEIIQMSPIGDRHLANVNRATETFSRAFAGKVTLSVQNPLQLSNKSEPEPDIVLLKRRGDFYSGKHPVAEDALLIVEVADTTFRFDRHVKLPLYAVAGVPEVWIEDLKGDLLLVFRNPVGKTYTTALTLRRGDSVSTLAFPDVVLTVEDFLG